MRKTKTICAWCKDKKYENRLLIRILEKIYYFFGFNVSHGCCNSCSFKYWREKDEKVSEDINKNIGSKIY